MAVIFSNEAGTSIHHVVAVRSLLRGRSSGTQWGDVVGGGGRGVGGGGGCFSDGTGVIFVL